MHNNGAEAARFINTLFQKGAQLGLRWHQNEALGKTV
jgi:hypothetical protein